MVNRISEWTQTVLRVVADALAHRPRLAYVKIAHELESIAADELPAFGHLLNQMSYYRLPEWDEIRPADVEAFAAEPSSRISVLGLFTFHRNGYVRHEAVRRLAREFHGGELRYLIIRQNDWVESISQEARQAVQERLHAGYLPEFVRLLPLVMRLLAYTRHEHAATVRKIVQLLCEADQRELLDEALGSAHRESHRQVARLALELPGDHRRRVIQRGVTSADGALRLLCCRAVASVVSGDELARILTELKKDPFMPTRREALRIEAQEFPASARAIWEAALLDRNIAIRNLARFELKKLGPFDAGAYYRAAIAQEPTNVVAICGLGETGDRCDLETLRRYLASPLPRYRRAALAGLASLGGDSVLDDLIKGLDDDYPSVTLASRKALRPMLHSLDAEHMFALATSDRPWHVRKGACELIFEMGRWRSLPWLIRLATQEDQRVADLSRDLATAWFSPPRSWQIFTSIQESDRQAIASAVETNQRRLPAQFLASIQDWVRRA